MSILYPADVPQNSFSKIPAGTAPQIRTIADVAPLDRQFGTYPKTTIPASLRPWLFDDHHGDCYALLDAAAIDDLPLIIENCGLPHACLFQGDARTDMGHVAPWIVRLSTDDLLTRRLFSVTDDGWGLWGEGVVFLCSTAPLDVLRKHFRRFTRLYDDGRGKWMYFRFYAAATMRQVIARMPADRLAHFSGPVSRFLVPDGDHALLIEPRENA